MLLLLLTLVAYIVLITPCPAQHNNMVQSMLLPVGVYSLISRQGWALPSNAATATHTCSFTLCSLHPALLKRAGPCQAMLLLIHSPIHIP